MKISREDVLRVAGLAYLEFVLVAWSGDGTSNPDAKTPLPGRSHPG